MHYCVKRNGGFADPPLSATCESLDTQPLDATSKPAGSTADEVDVLAAPTSSLSLRALCRHLDLSPQRKAAWSANGPHPALCFYLFFPFSAAQCALAVASFGIASPWLSQLLAVRIVPGWVHIAARVTTALWPWFTGPGRTPLLATAAAEELYAAVSVTTCLQPRVRMPFGSRLDFTIVTGVAVCCGCSALLVERPRDVKLGVGPVVWALAVRTARFVDVFTELAFAGLMLEDVRALPLRPA